MHVKNSIIFSENCLATLSEKNVCIFLCNITFQNFIYFYILYFRYNIQPINDINFGSMAVPSKKPRTFVIENKGERFEFKYTISKKVHESPTREDRR